MMRAAKGFTAVELLITLFVAATFLIAGYQLFNVVIVDGGDTRAESRATNVAYDFMRRYEDSAPNPCTTISPVASEATTAEGLQDVRATVTFSCVEGAPSTLSKMQVTIAYGTPVQEVEVSTFVDRSKEVDSVSDVTKNLVAWWRLNGGSANSSVGSANGTIVNAVSTSRNLVPDRAFYFNGTNAYITVPYATSTATRPAAAITASAWAYVSSATLAVTSNQKIFSTTESYGYNYVISSGNRVEAYLMINGTPYSVGVAETALIANSWNFVAFTYDGATIRNYINGVQVASAAATGYINHTTTTPFCIGAEPNATTCSSEYYLGSIDDVRVYDRALSSTEITQLYTGGER